jgi:hypothetical protein
MRGVSNRIFDGVATAVVIAALFVQPAMASAKAPEKGSAFGSLIKRVVRALEEIHISFPPG